MDSLDPTGNRGSTIGPITNPCQITIRTFPRIVPQVVHDNNHR
jgi:hypothetical protein